jgi:isoquinoline 1-oxidoreductase beta subunit
VIRACPYFGGKVAGFDAAAVADMPGVRNVVQVDETAVAVIADTWWRAKTALDALPVTWDEGPNREVTSASIAAMLEGGLDAADAFIGAQAGDARAALAAGGRTVTATYAFPYQNHATMEPMNATALYTPERCEVWVPTQNGEASLAAAAEAAGLPVQQCEVHKLHLGGGFGRRGRNDYTRQAVLIAKALPGTPVKLIWSREEDMLQGRFHPAMMAKMVGSFDKDNNLTGIHMRLSGQSILAAVRPQVFEQSKGMDPLVFQGVAQSGEHAFGYSIPNLLIDHSMRNPHVPPGFWRGVNINQNAVFFECFMDELAQAAGQDELEFRRKFLDKHPRNKAVLEAVAAKIGWGKPAPAGIFRGLAQMKAFGAYVAAAAEISVQDNGAKVKVHRIVAATDPGYIVNPAQVDRQVAGSFVYGLSALFMQECTVKDGRIVETNFDTYDSMRIAQMPKVESILMPAGGNDPWGGVGEPTICVAAPAVLNAYFKATGKRIRTVPLKNHNITLV